MDSHLEIQPATTLNGEQELLAAVIQDLNNDAAKLVYADWLEEHSDSRAQFLREYVAASQTMDAAAFPAIDSIPERYADWAHMIGCSFSRALSQQSQAFTNAGQDVKQLREQLLNAAVPSLLYKTEDEWTAAADGLEIDATIPIGGTKLFGLPDLPPGTVWPKQKDCNSFYDKDSGIDPETDCSFVGQINFEEFAQTQLGQFLPASGLLSIFSCAEIESIGMVDGYVIYSPDTNNLVRMEVPTDEFDEANQPIDAQRLSFSETLEFPFVDDESPFPYLKFTYDDPAYDLLGDLLDHPDHLEAVGGFTRPTSGGDPLPGAEWMKLICVQNSIEMMLHFCIRRDDLAKADFSNVALAWVDFD